MDFWLLSLSLLPLSAVSGEQLSFFEHRPLNQQNKTTKMPEKVDAIFVKTLNLIGRTKNFKKRMTFFCGNLQSA